MKHCCSTPWWRSLAALLLLWLPETSGVATPPDGTALIQRLQSGDDDARRAAAVDLGKMPPTPQILAALVDALGYTGNAFNGFSPGLVLGGGPDLSKAPKLTGPCCESLLGYGEAALDPVIKGMNSRLVWVRYGCAWILGNTKPGGSHDDQILLALRAGLSSPEEDANVMQMAAEGLGNWHDGKAAPIARTALQTRKMSGGDMSVLASLVARTDPVQGREVVLSFSRPAQPEGVRSAALVAARWLKDEDTLKILLDAIAPPPGKTKSKESYWFLGTACESLVRRNAAVAIPSLRKRLASKQWQGGDRLEVANTLALLGDGEARKVIESFADDKLLSSRAASFLKKLDSGNPLKPETPPGIFGYRYVHLGGGMMVMVR